MRFRDIIRQFQLAARPRKTHPDALSDAGYKSDPSSHSDSGAEPKPFTEPNPNSQRRWLLCLGLR